MEDVFLQLAGDKTSIYSFGFGMICNLDVCVTSMPAMPCPHHFQSSYEPLNQGNSLLPGSPWLQERQNRFGHYFRRGRLCASRCVLLRETWKQLLMNGIELHCDTLILLCRDPDGSKLNGVVPVAKQCDPKETY